MEDWQKSQEKERVRKVLKLVETCVMNIIDKRDGHFVEYTDPYNEIHTAIGLIARIDKVKLKGTCDCL